jgi:hypothetical protein
MLALWCSKEWLCKACGKMEEGFLRILNSSEGDELVYCLISLSHRARQACM